MCLYNFRIYDNSDYFNTEQIQTSPLLWNLARISWCTDPRIQLRNFYINSLPLLFHLIKLAYKGARPQIIIMMMCQHA